MNTHRHSDRLALSTSNYGQLQEGSNELFSELATRLPEIHSEVTRLGDQLRQLAADGAAAQLGGLDGTDADDMYGARSFVNDVVAENQAIALHIAEGAETLTSIATGLDPVLRIANSIRLMALNASFAAARCGNEARAFDALTRALGELADSFRRHANDLRETASGVGDSLGHIEELRTGVETQLTSVLADCVENVAALAEDVVKIIRSAIGAIAETAEEGQDFRPPIKRLMEAIQREDIIRQGMDHVLIVAREMQVAEALFDGVSASGNVSLDSVQSLLFIEKGGELTSRLVDSIDGELRELLREIGESLDDLDRLSERFNLRARELAANLDLERDLENLVQAMGQGLDSARVQARAITSYDKAFRAMEKSSDAIAAGMQQFEELRAQLRIINMMMKIQVGKSSALGDANDLTDSIAEADEEFVQFVSGFRREIKSVAQPLAAARTRVDRVSNASETRFSEIEDRFQLAADGLRFTAEEFGGGIGEVAAVADRVGMLVKGFGQGLSAFERKLTQQADLAQRCREASANAADLRRRYFGEHELEADRGLVDQRLGKLIERFTVLMHKEVAHEVIGVEIETGDEGGELTLF